MNNFIQFEFETSIKKELKNGIQVFYQILHFAKTRTYEVALSMVQSGRGVVLVPALAARLGEKLDFDVNLYKTNLPVRSIVSLIPTQYVLVEPYKSFIEYLKKLVKI